MVEYTINDRLCSVTWSILLQLCYCCQWLCLTHIYVIQAVWVWVGLEQIHCQRDYRMIVTSKVAWIEYWRCSSCVHLQCGLTRLLWFLLALTELDVGHLGQRADSFLSPSKTRSPSNKNISHNKLHPTVNGASSTVQAYVHMAGRVMVLTKPYWAQMHQGLIIALSSYLHRCF